MLKGEPTKFGNHHKGNIPQKGPFSMAMHHLQVFLNEDALVQLEDEFVDKDDDLRHLVYDPVKQLAKQAKMILLNKQFVANLYDEDAANNSKQETIKLKEFNLDKFAVKSDVDWLPENVSKDEAKPYKIRVGDRTWKLLETFFKLYDARVDIYNKSLDRGMKDYEDKKAKPAKCWQQIIHDALIGPVMQKIDKSIDKELEDEFKEVYKPKSEQKEGPKRAKRKKSKNTPEPEPD